MRAAFGPFSFDLCALDLSKNGIRLRLEEKPARLLACLIEQKGEIVAREELRKRLWPDHVNVDFDHGLNKAANKLRAMLGDSAAKPRYIETLSRRGYRFIHPVELISDPGARPEIRSERAGESSLEISGSDEVAPPEATFPPAELEAQGSRRTRPRLQAWLVLLAAALAAFVPAAGTLGHLTHLRSTGARHILLPDGLQPMIVGDGTLALSPDGALVAFAGAGTDRQPRLWVLDLNSSQAKELPGTEGGTMPFWAPDGHRLGFFTVFELNTIDLTSYAIKELAHVNSARGGSWSSRGVILFASETRGPIFRVPAEGGTAVPVTAVNAESGASTHRWPAFFPDGNHFVYLEASHDHPDAPGRVMLGSLDGGNARFLLESDSNSIPSGDRIAFVSHGKLLAVPLRSFEAETNAKILADGVECDRGSWYCAFDLNGSGGLYRPRSTVADRESIAWFDVHGNQIATVGPPGVYRTVDLSPDGRTVAVTCGDPDEKACLIRDDGTVTRLDSLGIVSGSVWAPDSSAIAYLDHESNSQFFFKIKPVLQPLPARTVYRSKIDVSPLAWHPNGRYLLFSRALPDGKYDAGVLDLRTDETMPYLPPDSYPIDLPRFSPDGRWVAFAKQTGRLSQIYLASYPVATKLISLTTGGGCSPKWRSDGREIEYLGPSGTLYSVSLTPVQKVFRIGNPIPLFRPSIFYAPWDRVSFDVSKRGDRFVINTVEFPRAQELISIPF
jgi:DNA-binding winged helix-turn-helix (wHTH) protein/Tol biopolymer transport system component